MINIYEPNISKYTESSINAIRDGWISNHGEFVELANNKLKEITKIKFSILMSNGTCATHCLFLTLKYKYPNIDKIYVPNNCYIAAWNAALMVYNIDKLEVMKMSNDTWNVMTNEEYIRTLDKNSAVLIVHNLGNIINVPRLKRMRPDLIFIEDNCEGMFGEYENIFSGMSQASLCSSCSFYGNKIITTGEGGAFFTQDESIYNYIKSIYSQGMSDTKYLHKLHAYNYRMTNIQAGFLYEQLSDIDNILHNKYRIFETYDILLQGLHNLGKIKKIKEEANTKLSPWIYALRIVHNTKNINETNNFFKLNDIDIRPFFYPINSHEHLKCIKNNDEESYVMNKEIIMIPSSPSITYKQQRYIVSTIYKFIFNCENIDVIELSNTNQYDIFQNFLLNINDNKFRYFNTRSIECLKNHIITLILYDKKYDKYIGYVHIDFEYKYWLGIYIVDEYQNKKLGSLLLQFILQHEKVYDINEINLTVDIDNKAAIKLYKNLNFEIIETKNTYHVMKRLNQL